MANFDSRPPQGDSTNVPDSGDQNLSQQQSLSVETNLLAASSSFKTDDTRSTTLGPDVLPDTSIDFGSEASLDTKFGTNSTGERIKDAPAGTKPQSASEFLPTLDIEMNPTSESEEHRGVAANQPEASSQTRFQEHRPDPADTHNDATDGAEEKGGDRGETRNDTADSRTPVSEIPNDSPLLKNIGNPDQFKADMKETAQKLVAAGDNPDQAAKIFNEAAAKFSRENPNAAGSTFSTALQNALRNQPGNHGLSSEFEASEGERQGRSTNLLLRRTEGDSAPQAIAQAEHEFSTGATEQERKQIAADLTTALPNEAGELSGPESMQRIVDVANDMIKAHELGEDVGPMFEKAAREFQENNPGASGSAFSRLINGALERNPQSTPLRTTGAFGDGEFEGTSDIKLIDPELPPDDKTIARTSISFKRN